MANVLTVVWFLIGYVASLTAVLVWTAMMLPRPVEAARGRVVRRPVVHFFVGVAVLVVTLVIATGFLKEGRAAPLQLIGWGLMGPMLAGWVVGGAAFATLLADRIRAHSPGTSPIVALTGGALCTALGGLVPVAGWFLFIPLVGFIAIGSGTLSLFSRKKKAQPTSEPAANPPAAEPAPAGPEPAVVARTFYTGPQGGVA